MRAISFLLSVLVVLHASSVVMAATDCSLYYISDTCSDCIAYSDCGWCTFPQVGSSTYVNSSCISGNWYGPKDPSACSGGIWHNGAAATCGDECSWKCGLSCDSDQWCETWSIGDTYNCSCNDNPFKLLGMALATFILVTVFVTLAICVGIICCCYFACRTPTTVITSPQIAVVAPPAGHMYYQPQPQYQYAQYQQQPQQQMHNPSYVSAQPYSSQPMQQPLLAGQQTSSDANSTKV